MNNEQSQKPERNHKHKYGSEYMVTELLINGLVNKPLTLTVADLKKMRDVEIKELTMYCGSGQKKKVIDSYRGVLLQDIMNLADVIIADHHAPNRLYLTLRSNDGYLTVLSWLEITNSILGEKAIVAYERDGNLLNEDEGCFVFVSGNDLRPGPRRMRYLKEITVCEVI